MAAHQLQTLYAVLVADNTERTISKYIISIQFFVKVLFSRKFVFSQLFQLFNVKEKAAMFKMMFSKHCFKLVIPC